VLDSLAMMSVLTKYCLTKARTLRMLVSIVEPISSQKFPLICRLTHNHFNDEKLLRLAACERADEAECASIPSACMLQCSDH
jgi:hypothetical protein